jgi:acetyl esterase
MTKEQVRKRDLHPAYDVACNEIIPENDPFQNALREALNNNLEPLKKIRGLEEKGHPDLSLRETLKVKREISGGPENIKVNISIYRPVGSENEILPIMIYS